VLLSRELYPETQSNMAVVPQLNFWLVSLHDSLGHDATSNVTIVQNMPETNFIQKEKKNVENLLLTEKNTAHLKIIAAKEQKYEN
jgi:hypothetical protein